MADCHADSVATLPAVEAGEQHRLVAIIGPPNAGKSTLFNRLTGMRQKVANFPGVTVEHHLGKVRLDSGREIFAVDLPGIYSLQPRTDDERVTHDVLLGKMEGLARPDAVLLVLDSTNLGRHLMLAAPVLSLGLPTLVVLNMADDLSKRGGSLDVAALSAQLGAPVVMTSAKTGDGFEKVIGFLSGASSTGRVAPMMQLPVLQNVPSCRQWATEVGAKGRYRAPAPPLSDTAPGRYFPAQGVGTRDLRSCGRRGIPGNLLLGHTADGRRVGCDRSIGCMARRPDRQSSIEVAGRRRHLERRRQRAGVPAADPAAVLLYRSPRRLRLPRPRGDDCGSHHVARRLAGQELHSPALRLRLRGAPPSWRRAPSRTNATASRRF